MGSGSSLHKIQQGPYVRRPLDDPTQDAMLAGQYDIAIAKYSEMLDKEDHGAHNAQLLVSRGQVYIKLAKLAVDASNSTKFCHLALSDFEKAVALVPAYTFGWVCLGAGYSTAGDHINAIASLNTALSMNPADPFTYEKRGVAYQALKQDTEALRDFNKVLSLSPSPAVQAVVYGKRGVAYHRMERYMEAVESFSLSLKLDPNNPVTYNNRGCTYHTMGQYYKAIEDFSHAIYFKPDYAEAYSNKGRSLHALAIEGSAYQRSERFGQAIQYYTKAISLDPKLVMAHVARTKAIHDMENQESLSRAINQCTTFVKKHPDANAFSDLGRVYNAEGNHNEALENCSKACRLAPKNATVFFNRAKVFLAQGLVENALEDLTRTISLDPNNIGALCTRADCYRQVGDYEKAVVNYERAIKLRPRAVDAIKESLRETTRLMHAGNQSSRAPPEALANLTVGSLNTSSGPQLQNHWKTDNNWGKYDPHFYNQDVERRISKNTVQDQWRHMELENLLLESETRLQQEQAKKKTGGGNEPELAVAYPALHEAKSPRGAGPSLVSV